MEQGCVPPAVPGMFHTALGLNEQPCSTFFASRHIKTPLWGCTSSGSGEV